MQLPPTILSLNSHKKKKEGSVSTKAIGKKTTTPKAKSDPKTKSAAPDPLPIQVPQEDHKADSSDESDEEGDTVMKDDDDIFPLLDGAGAGTSVSGGKKLSTVKSLDRGALKPPRTLETTLFDRLEKMYGPGIKRLLNVQYRYRSHFLGTVCDINSLRFLG
jgi:DNA polymerase alpha-associated DNA helicase A